MPTLSSFCLSRALTVSTNPAQILGFERTIGTGPLLESRRSYAKGKNKVKSGKSNVVISEEEIGQLVDVRALKGQLEDLVNEMKEEFAQSLSIRGASGHLETLQVEFDGQSYPLQELAQVGRKNPQMAVLNLSSLPEACQAVMQAIQESGMNVNPQQEGTTIYVPLPKVTREHRENLAKNAKVLFTKYKVLLQGVQNRYVKEGKRQTEMSEDLIFSVQHQIMKLTEGYIAEAEKLMLTKQKELLDTK